MKQSDIALASVVSLSAEEADAENERTQAHELATARRIVDERGRELGAVHDEAQRLRKHRDHTIVRTETITRERDALLGECADAEAGGESAPAPLMKKLRSLGDQAMLLEKVLPRLDAKIAEMECLEREAQGDLDRAVYDAEMVATVAATIAMVKRVQAFAAEIRPDFDRWHETLCRALDAERVMHSRLGTAPLISATHEALKIRTASLRLPGVDLLEKLAALFDHPVIKPRSGTSSSFETQVRKPPSKYATTSAVQRAADAPLESPKARVLREIAEERAAREEQERNAVMARAAESALLSAGLDPELHPDAWPEGVWAIVDEEMVLYDRKHQRRSEGDHEVAILGATPAEDVSGDASAASTSPTTSEIEHAID